MSERTFVNQLMRQAADRDVPEWRRRQRLAETGSLNLNAPPAWLMDDTMPASSDPSQPTNLPPMPPWPKTKRHHLLGKLKRPSPLNKPVKPVAGIGGTESAATAATDAEAAASRPTGTPHKATGPWQVDFIRTIALVARATSDPIFMGWTMTPIVPLALAYALSSGNPNLKLTVSQANGRFGLFALSNDWAPDLVPDLDALVGARLAQTVRPPEPPWSIATAAELLAGWPSQLIFEMAALRRLTRHLAVPLKSSDTAIQKAIGVIEALVTAEAGIYMPVEFIILFILLSGPKLYAQLGLKAADLGVTGTLKMLAMVAKIMKSWNVSTYKTLLNALKAAGWQPHKS